MVYHNIIWTLKADLKEKEKLEAKIKIKEGLEALAGKIDGLISIRVQTDFLPTSSDSVLYLMSTFENAEALSRYAVHPEHLKVADLVRSVVCDRKCVDFKD